MQNEENLSVTTNILPASVVLIFPTFKFIKYFCEPSLEGYSIQNRKKVTIKILWICLFLKWAVRC